jgi:hypothetical protein
MRVRVMTNPAQLLLAGNPGRKRTRRKVYDPFTGKKVAVKPIRVSMGGDAFYRDDQGRKVYVDTTKPNPSTPSRKKERPMAKRRKSKASREKRIAKRKARRASRKGKMPAGLRAYWAKRKSRSGGKSVRRKSRRRSRKARLHIKRRKSRARRSRRHVGIKNVVASRGTKVVVRKVRRGRVRYAKKRSGRRVGVVGVNAGSLTLAGGLTNFIGNAKATMKDGVNGFAFAFGGAAVSVAGGAFTSQVTGNLLARFAPGLLGNPILSRLLGAVNYYLPGWAASKFIPGLSGKSRRAMLTGAAAAALLEVVRPGMIRGALQQVPVIGGLMGMAEDQASDLGAYVGYALNGTNDHHGDGYAAQYEDTRDNGVEGYVALQDYVSTGGQDAAQNMGVADYVDLAR